MISQLFLSYFLTRFIQKEEISPYYRLSTAQVEALAKDLTGDDAAARIEAAQHIGKFVLEPAKALIKYITTGDCIETLTVSVLIYSSFFLLLNVCYIYI